MNEPSDENQPQNPANAPSDVPEVHGHEVGVPDINHCSQCGALLVQKSSDGSLWQCPVCGCTNVR